MKNSSKKKVYVALSGGVDSSVSLALLQQQGYNCTGVFMKNWSGDDWGVKGDCPWKQDQKDAETVCKILKVPFKSLNFEKEYREKVIEYFFTELKHGRTPNPDILCNELIKFGVFLDRAGKEGANLIATGHYARIKVKKENKYALLKGIDLNKDQSYFLYRLNQLQLSKTLFPIGNFEKPEVRKLAKKYRLPTAEKKDSQGICFVGKINIDKFIKDTLGERKGDMVDVTGKKIGEHNGTWFFTVGQRKGIGLSGGPYYVTEIDHRNNRVVIARGKQHESIYKSTIEVEHPHWISGKSPTLPLRCEVATRYTHNLSKARLHILHSKLLLKFYSPHRAPTPGQSAVFYKGDTCLGGAYIL